jgi:hypothetical protein
MLREDSHCPRPEGGGIKLFINDADGEGIHHLHFLYRFIVCEPRGEVLWVHDPFIGEFDIIGIQGVAIMKLHIGPQVKNDDRIVLHGGQDFVDIVHLFVRFNLRDDPYVFLPVEGAKITLPEDLGKALEKKLIHFF